MKSSNPVSFNELCWIGDPCYVVPDKKWHDVCHLMFTDNTRDDACYLEDKGVVFCALGTAYGDGCYYPFRNGKPIGECGVDSGTLSVIPMRLIKLWKASKEKISFGVVVEVEGTIEVEETGVWTVGDISVDTLDTFGDFEDEE